MRLQASSDVSVVVAREMAFGRTAGVRRDRCRPRFVSRSGPDMRDTRRRLEVRIAMYRAAALSFYSPLRPPPPRRRPLSLLSAFLHTDVIL